PRRRHELLRPGPPDHHAVSHKSGCPISPFSDLRIARQRDRARPAQPHHRPPPKPPAANPKYPRRHCPRPRSSRLLPPPCRLPTPLRPDRDGHHPQHAHPGQLPLPPHRRPPTRPGPPHRLPDCPGDHRSHSRHPPRTFPNPKSPGAPSFAVSPQRVGCTNATQHPPPTHHPHH